MKKCSKCGIEKDWIRFHKESRKQDGFCSHCKDCESIRTKQRMEKDPDLYRKNKRENARKHSEKTKIKVNQKYQENKEEILSKNRERYWENREEIIARRKEIGKTPEAKKKDAERQKKWQQEHRENTREAALKYAKNNREKVNDWHAQWKKNNLEKSRAQSLLKYHVRKGNITRPTNCSKCMKECKPEGHHEDYSKPLEVQWLCKVCHNHKHNKLLDVKTCLKQVETIFT